MAGMAKPKIQEIHSDAWERFERAVEVVAKSPPQHRTKTDKNPKAKRPKAAKKTPR